MYKRQRSVLNLFQVYLCIFRLSSTNVLRSTTAATNARYEYVIIMYLCLDVSSSLVLIMFSVVEINPQMLRPIMLQNSHFPMAPPANTPTGEYVQNMPAMPTGQYDPPQNFADPNTGMVYTPQQ